MAITLGSIVFDEDRTTVAEKYEEVGGRDERRVTVTGVIVGESALAAVEARLDAILAAVPDEDYAVALSVRAGRRIHVARTGFSREVARDSLVGSFVLELAARDPYEESVEETTVAWSVTASGATRQVTSSGNVFARPIIALAASGDVVNPSFNDGMRTLLYSGVVGDGETLVIDGASACVTLDGEDVTPYTSGDFPCLDPGETTLTYVDDASSSHTALVTISYRDRWW